MSTLLGQTVNIKTLESFGTVSATVLEISGSAAKIKFKSSGSTYTMIVPVTWLSVKTSDGSTGVIAAKATVDANIQVEEVLTRKGTILEIGATYLVAQTGGRIRMIPFSRIKDISVAAENVTTAVVPVAKAAPAKASPAAKGAKVAPVIPTAPVKKAKKV